MAIHVKLLRFHWLSFCFLSLMASPYHFGFKAPTNVRRGLLLKLSRPEFVNMVRS